MKIATPLPSLVIVVALHLFATGCAPPTPPATTASKPTVQGGEMEDPAPKQARRVVVEDEPEKVAVAPPPGGKPITMAAGKPIQFGDIQVVLEAVEPLAGSPGAIQFRFKYTNTSETKIATPPSVQLRLITDEFGNGYQVAKLEYSAANNKLFPGDSGTVMYGFGQFVPKAKQFTLTGQILHISNTWQIKVAGPLPRRN